MFRPVSACGGTFSPGVASNSDPQRHIANPSYFNIPWPSPPQESSTCSCGCDIHNIFGMGMKHSKSKRVERKVSNKKQKKTCGIPTGDNNHHNHHFASSSKGRTRHAPSPHNETNGIFLNQSHISPDSIRIHKFKAGIDKKLTSLDEKSPGVLKYKTPHFRATSVVDIPALREGAAIQVGWIQTCTHMQFLNTYGQHGMTSWEFPEIISRNYSMVSDADGKLYPWYGARQEVHTLTGPHPRQQITLEMNDNFFPQVTWCIPTDAYDRKPRLTQIHRSQKFNTFLAMKNLTTNEVHILRAISWTMELTIGVDPTKPLGQRAWLVGPKDQEAPKLIDSTPPIPEYALRSPNANRSQSLIWRPRIGEPKLVVKPLETTIDINKYVSATRGMGQEFQALLPES